MWRVFVVYNRWLHGIDLEFRISIRAILYGKYYILSRFVDGLGLPGR
jgi:hypothetical protein